MTDCWLYQEKTLLDVKVSFVVVDHALPNHLNWLEFFEHNRLSALLADAVGQMVQLFAVRH